MSTTIPVFRGIANERGTVDLEQPVQFRHYVRKLHGHAVEVVVRRPRTHRSVQQLKYYWGVVVKTIAFELGYTSDELHEALKFKFLLENPDAAIPKARSTTELTSDEFTVYVDTVIQFAAEQGIYIPAPGEVDL